MHSYGWYRISNALGGHNQGTLPYMGASLGYKYSTSKYLLLPIEGQAVAADPQGCPNTTQKDDGPQAQNEKR